MYKNREYQRLTLTKAKEKKSDEEEVGGKLFPSPDQILQVQKVLHKKGSMYFVKCKIFQDISKSTIGGGEGGGNGELISN